VAAETAFAGATPCRLSYYASIEAIGAWIACHMLIWANRQHHGNTLFWGSDIGGRRLAHRRVIGRSVEIRKLGDEPGF